MIDKPGWIGHGRLTADGMHTHEVRPATDGARALFALLYGLALLDTMRRESPSPDEPPRPA